MKKYHKICPTCKSKKTIKKGKSRGRQQYQCKECKKKFVSQKRHSNKKERDFLENYIFHKQTYRELKERYTLSKRKAHAFLEDYQLKEKKHAIRPVHIEVDAVYFGSRIHGTEFCMIVVRDRKRKENLYASYEKKEDSFGYMKARIYLEQKGYSILSVTGDGFRAIKQVFSGIPYQMCQVHMERIIIRKTTRNPQTQAGKDLLSLGEDLHNMTSTEFKRRVQTFSQSHRDFLLEKTYHPLTGRSSYTHRSLRSAHRSLLFFRESLFTFEENSCIPKNTNSIEGHFSHVRDIMNIHRSLSLKLKIKVLMIIFLASTIAPTKEKIKEIL